MYKRNDGTDSINALQNQFTAYLAKAVRNKKIRYINNRSKHNQTEISTDMQDYYLFISDTDEISVIDERDELHIALNSIETRERYVIISHVFEDKSFAVIAAELNISYKGAAAIYYRAIAKLKKLLGDAKNEL